MLSFTPKQTLDSALRFWWLVVVMMLLGAIAGWAFFLVRPAVYEGRASLTTGIDYTRTGPLYDVEEDQAMQVVGDVIDGDDTKQLAIELASREGNSLTRQDFESGAFLERSNYAWVIRFQHADPQIAAGAANAWLEAAYAVLEEAYNHALIAEELVSYTRSLTTCFENSVASEPIQGFCTTQNLDEIQQELLAVNEAKTAELLASRGLFPGMAFAISERASIPSSPVQFGRNGLVFSGAGVGFLAAVWVIALQIPAKIGQRAKRD